MMSEKMMDKLDRFVFESTTEERLWEIENRLEKLERVIASFARSWFEDISEA